MSSVNSIHRFDEDRFHELCQVYEDHCTKSPDRMFVLIESESSAVDPNTTYNLCPELFSMVTKITSMTPEQFRYIGLTTESLKKLEYCERDKTEAKLLLQIYNKLNSQYISPVNQQQAAAYAHLGTKRTILGKPEWEHLKQWIDQHTQSS